MVDAEEFGQKQVSIFLLFMAKNLVNNAIREASWFHSFIHSFMQENPMIEKREGLRKKKEKTRKMLARLRKPVSTNSNMMIFILEMQRKTDDPYSRDAASTRAKMIIFASSVMTVNR